MFRTPWRGMGQTPRRRIQFDNNAGCMVVKSRHSVAAGGGSNTAHASSALVVRIAKARSAPTRQCMLVPPITLGAQSSPNHVARNSWHGSLYIVQCRRKLSSSTWHSVSPTRGHAIPGEWMARYNASVRGFTPGRMDVAFLRLRNLRRVLAVAATTVRSLAESRTVLVHSAYAASEPSVYPAGWSLRLDQYLQRFACPSSSASGAGGLRCWAIHTAVCKLRVKRPSSCWSDRSRSPLG